VTNTAPEIDGVIRRIPLIMKIGKETYPAMAIEVIRVATRRTKLSGEDQALGRYYRYESTRILIQSDTDANARIWLRWNNSYETIVCNRYKRSSTSITQR
jgi:hypothetical protein